MNNVTQIVQNVRQAPWRVQRQWIGLFLLVLVLMAMVAGLYLNVTVGAALAGRESISLQAIITTNQRVNADLETRLARLTSITAMQSRAEDLGFEPASLDDITYIAVPGYMPMSTVNLSQPALPHQEIPLLIPAYTESWFDYFINEQVSSSTGDQP